MNKKVVLIIILGCMFLVGVILSGLRVDHGPGYKGIEDLVGKKAPDILLPKLAEGKNEKNLNGSNNELSVIVLWSTWCNVCPKYLKSIKEVKQKYSINTIGILLKDDPEKAVKYLKSVGDPFNSNYIETDENIFGKKYHVISLGETVIIDRNNIVVKRLYGENLGEELNEYLEEYFKQKI